MTCRLDNLFTKKCMQALKQTLFIVIAVVEMPQMANRKVDNCSLLTDAFLRLRYFQVQHRLGGTKKFHRKRLYKAYENSILSIDE